MVTSEISSMRTKKIATACQNFVSARKSFWYGTTHLQNQNEKVFLLLDTVPILISAPLISICINLKQRCLFET